MGEGLSIKRRILFVLILVLMIGVFSLGVIGAQPPPQVNVNTDIGYSVEFSKIDILELNQNFTFNFHVFNRSDGLRLDNSSVNCSLHLFNDDGSHLVQNHNIPFEETHNDWELLIVGGNFSSIGEYSILTDCNNGDFGGFVSFGLEVTPTGSVLETPQAIVYFILLSIIVLTFLCVFFGIGLLPASNKQDEEGKILNVTYLKYLRSTLWFFEWIFLIAIFYLSSNLAFAFLNEQLFAKILFVLFQITFSITPVIVILWVFWIVLKLFQDKKIQKSINRGIFPQGRTA